jgi:hypothetical protein
MTDFANDIPLSLAVAAHSGTSFSPERRGETARNDYAAGLAADYEHFRAQAEKGGTLDLLPAEFERYRASLAKRYRAYLASSSRCVSSFIAGPSNFPAARMNKRADIAHKRLTEYCEFQQRARAAIVRTLRPDLAPIRTEDDNAAERLRKEIEQAEQLQARMKAANLAIRQNKKAGREAQIAALVALGISEKRAPSLLEPDFAGRIGFADYQLTNNGANIRRMRQRLVLVETAKATPTTEAKGKAATVEDDPPANRVRLFFPGKPDASIRDRLKANGFRWSPTIGAWQAYRNHRAIEIARQVAGVEG